MVNCRHYPSVFIPGLSTVSAEPVDEEENERVYQLTQQQRAMERKLRGYRLNEATLKAQGAPRDEVLKAHAAVIKQSSRIDVFCDENDLPRRRNREYTPVNATWPEE